MATLFQDTILTKAEEDIASFEKRGHSGTSYHKKGYHPYERHEKHQDSKSEKLAWKNIGYCGQGRKQKGKDGNYSSQFAKGQSSYKWQLLCQSSSIHMMTDQEQRDCKNCSVPRDNNTKTS